MQIICLSRSKMKIRNAIISSFCDGRIFSILFILLIQNSVSHGQEKETFSCRNNSTIMNIDGSTIGMTGEVSEEELRILMGCRGDEFDSFLGQPMFGFTFPQVKAFYGAAKEKTKALSNTASRPIQLCITKQQSEEPRWKNSKLSGFTKILEEIDKFNANPSNAIVMPEIFTQSKTPSVKEIVISTIGTTDKSLPILHQWMHVNISMHKKFQMAIVQPIDGVLGVPFGEMVKFHDLPCNDITLSDAIPEESTIEMVPCRFRPRAMYRHPSVLLFDYRGPLNFERSSIRFHFNWMNVACQELVAFKFLIITVPKINEPNHFTAEFSPVYEFFTRDINSIDGVPTDPTIDQRKYAYKCFYDSPSGQPLEFDNVVDYEDDMNESEPEDFIEPVNEYPTIDESPSESLFQVEVDETQPLDEFQEEIPDNYNGANDEILIEEPPTTIVAKKLDPIVPFVLPIVINTTKVEDEQVQTPLLEEAPTTNHTKKLDPIVPFVLPIIEDTTEVKDVNVFEDISNSSVETSSEPFITKGNKKKRPKINVGQFTNLHIKRVRRQATSNTVCRDVNFPCNSITKPKEEGICIADMMISVCENSIIKYNNEYDDCIMGKTEVENGGCPPGPFQCGAKSLCSMQSQSSNTKWRRTKISILRGCSTIGTDSKCVGYKGEKDKDSYHFKNEEVELFRRSDPSRGKRKNKRMANNGRLEAKASFLGHRARKIRLRSARSKGIRIRAGNNGSTAEKSPFITAKEAIQLEFLRFGTYYHKKQKRLHGNLEIFAYLVLVPIAILISRFFKETVYSSVFGIPLWLMLHLLVTYLSILCMWVGVISVAGSGGNGTIDCDQLKNIKNSSILKDCEEQQGAVPHIIFGSITFIVYHFSALLGWYRPHGHKKRMIFVLIHTGSGYIAYLLGVIATFIENASVCKDVFIFCGFLISISIASFVALSVVQIFQDKKMEVKGRGFFPHLEGIDIREAEPFILVKMILMGSIIVIHLVFYFMLVGFYANIANKEDSVFGGRKDATEEEFLNHLITVNGFFVESCHTLNTQAIDFIIDNERVNIENSNGNI